MTQNPLKTYQNSLINAVDGAFDQVEEAVIDHLETRMLNFLTGGGLQERLNDRMRQHHDHFRQTNTQEAAALPTRGKGFGKSAALPSANLAGGNRDV